MSDATNASSRDRLSEGIKLVVLSVAPPKRPDSEAITETRIKTQD